MTGDVFKRLFLGLALAADRRLRRVILRLSEAAPPAAEADGAEPPERVFRFPEAGPDRAETRSGPPGHWVDRVRKHAPELLLPAAEPPSAFVPPDSARLPARQDARERQAPTEVGPDRSRRASGKPQEAPAAQRSRRSGDAPEAESVKVMPHGGASAIHRASGREGPGDGASRDGFSGRAGRAKHPPSDFEHRMPHPPVQPLPGRAGAPGLAEAPAGAGRGSLGGPEETPGRETPSFSGRRVVAEGVIPSGETADAGRLGKRPPSAEAPPARPAAGGKAAPASPKEIGLPAASRGRESGAAPGGGSGDAAPTRPPRRAAAPRADSDGGSSTAWTAAADFRPEGEEDRIPEPRFRGALRPGASAVSADAAEPRWTAPSWPPLPGEDPSEGALGPGRSGPWPLLMEEVRVRAAEAPGGIEPPGIREAVRNIERLARLEKEQAGSPWNA